MQRKKADNHWIDGSMFWYTYGATPNTRRKWGKSDEEEDEDEEQSPMSKENSNGDLKGKKVTFVGKIEHEYEEDEVRKNNGIIGASVEMFKEAKNKLSDKLLDYYYEKAPFYAETIKERFEDLLDILPFYQRPEVTTEVISTKRHPKPTVLRPQDVPNQDSDTNIGILVTINDKVERKKSKLSLLSILSENIFPKKESEKSKNVVRRVYRPMAQGEKPPSNLKGSETSKGELNNHNSLHNETTKFFVFEPMDEGNFKKSLSIIEKPSLWNKFISTGDNINKNNNKKIFIRKNKTFNSNNKLNSTYKGYKIKRIRNDKKVILNDPSLPKKKMDSRTKVKHWMNNKENQKALGLKTEVESPAADLPEEGRLSSGVSELVRRFEVVSPVNMQQVDPLAIKSSVSVKEHIKYLDKVLFKKRSSLSSTRFVSPKLSVPKNLTPQPTHPAVLPPSPPPLPPLPPITNKTPPKRPSRKSSKNNYDQSVCPINSTKTPEQIDDESPLNKIGCFNSKEESSIPKKVKHPRSISAKNLLREFVKKTFKLKSLSPVSKKLDGDHDIPTPLSAGTSKNISTSLNNTTDDKTGTSYTSFRESRGEQNTSARNSFFGLPDRQENISRNNHSFHVGSSNENNYIDTNLPNCDQMFSKSFVNSKAGSKQIAGMEAKLIPSANKTPHFDSRLNSFPMPEELSSKRLNSGNIPFLNKSLPISKDPQEDNLFKFYEKSKNFSWEILNSNYENWKQNYGPNILAEFRKVNDTLHQNVPPTMDFTQSNDQPMRTSPGCPIPNYHFLLQQFQKQQMKKIGKQQLEKHQLEKQQLKKQQHELRQEQLKIQQQLESQKQQHKALKCKLQQEEMTLQPRYLQQKFESTAPDTPATKPHMQQNDQQSPYKRALYPQKYRHPNQSNQTRHHSKQPHKHNKRQQKHHATHKKPVYQVNSTVFTVFDKVISQLKDEELGRVNDRFKKNIKENGDYDCRDSSKEMRGDSFECRENMKVLESQIHNDENNPSSKVNVVKSLIKIFEPTY